MSPEAREYVALLHAIVEAVSAHDAAGARHLICRGIMTPSDAPLKPGEGPLLVAYSRARVNLDRAKTNLEQWERSHDWVAVMTEVGLLSPDCADNDCDGCEVLS